MQARLFFQRLQILPDGVVLLAGLAGEEIGERGFAVVVGEAGHLGLGVDAEGEEEPAVEVFLAQALAGVGEIGRGGLEDGGGGAVAEGVALEAVEAAIFAVAAATDYEQFKAIWNTRQGTGGAVLKVLKNVPDDLRWFLNTAWQVMAKLGHASDGPVLSSMTSFSDAGEVRTGISFAGQFGGALDARQLDGCVDSFCIAATANVEVMNLCLRPEFTTFDEWSRRFDTLRQHLDKREPIPPERAEHYERYRKRFGPRPESSGGAPTTP